MPQYNMRRKVVVGDKEKETPGQLFLSFNDLATVGSAGDSYEK
jgi:hypothetical protein